MYSFSILHPAPIDFCSLHFARLFLRKQFRNNMPKDQYVRDPYGMNKAIHIKDSLASDQIS